ncbi:F-box/kelch-repeat protein At3g06240-like [Papaver somniferum]|uniref:F-box/kelch-repeat protein At3g06240-like n=1 Tax=Papaver somniferum TaxID=3469 RepID=UPI000E6F8E8C|nr:F-box/kelch-repeat protein At3g06240-like [Papaver somniferum]
MSSFPEELYHEILLRLPVKSLLVCKSVCWNWYALISTSDFVETHIAIQEEKPILMLEGSHRNISIVYSINYDSLASSSIGDAIDAIEMDYPFKSLGYGIVQLFGSANGLVCVWLFDNGGNRYCICLWNPATGEYKEIPPLSAIRKYCHVQLHAFGYDRKTDDYKLLMGVEAPESKDSTLIHVYRLASNSWVTGKTIPCRFHYDQRSGVSSNGDLHWVPLGHDKYLLLSLDISDENFKEMQIPKELACNNANQYLFLGVLEWCLCLLVSLHVDGQFEVRVMLEYGVRESWTKRYVIGHESLIHKQFFFRIVWSFENGKMLFLNGDGLVLYDLKYGSATELILPNNPFLYFIHTKSYFESLVSPNSGTYNGGETAQ